MIELGDGLTVLGGAIGGKDILIKIFGPTADYIGANLKAWTEKGTENIANIIKNATKKLGNKIEEDGNVSPKVLKGILEDGYWSEGALQVEYFGGVLASSRTGISRDDRGAYFNSIIAGLSSYQLRTHYIIYHCLKKVFNGRELNIAFSEDRNTMKLFILFSIYESAMDFVGNNEESNSPNLLGHSIWGLGRMELIENNFMYGPAEFIRKTYKEATNDGIIITPSSLGIELFMWAYGYGQLDTNSFFGDNIIFEDDQNIKIGDVVGVNI